MAKIYINLHNGCDYAMAVIQGYIDLRAYVRQHDYLLWCNEVKGQTKIMIKRFEAGENNINSFIEYLKQNNCEVYTRNERIDEWQRVE